VIEEAKILTEHIQEVLKGHTLRVSVV